MRVSRRPSAVHWPFWLLIAAWFCANVPATATVHALVWLKGAQHFSHSAELRQDVAALLTGQPRPSSPRLAAAETAAHSLPPALPLDRLVKKTDLALAAAPHRLIGRQAPGFPVVSLVRAPAEPVADVPYPPPRARGQA